VSKAVDGRDSRAGGGLRCRFEDLLAGPYEPIGFLRCPESREILDVGASNESASISPKNTTSAAAAVLRSRGSSEASSWMMSLESTFADDPCLSKPSQATSSLVPFERPVRACAHGPWLPGRNGALHPRGFGDAARAHGLGAPIDDRQIDRTAEWSETEPVAREIVDRVPSL